MLAKEQSIPFLKNKEELFDEIVTTLIMEMKDSAEEILDESLSFSENLHNVLFKILEFRKEHQLTIKLFQEERDMGTPAVSEVIQKVETVTLNYIKGIIQDAIDKGDIKQW